MDKQPRICVVSPLYHTSFGGVGRQAVALTEKLEQRGVRPFVITRNIKGLPACPLSDHVPLYRIPTLFPRVRNLEDTTLINLLVSWSFCIGLAILLVWKKGSYDVVHFHGASLPLIKNILLLKLLRKKVIAKVVVAKSGVEAGSLAGRYLGMGRLMIWMLRLVDRYAAISSEIEADLLDEGYERNRVVRIPNFVDPDVFHPGDEAAAAKVRKEHGWENRKLVTFSGRLVERKGIDVLLQSWKTVAAEHETAQLIILGDGPMNEKLRVQTTALGLKERVEFLGFVSDIPEYLAASDIFVFPSLREGFPNALLEAMACALPVVASAIGGVTDVIIDKENGLLTGPGNEDELAAAIGTLLNDPDQARALGEKALETIRREYLVDAIANKYISLYEELTDAAQ